MELHECKRKMEALYGLRGRMEVAEGRQGRDAADPEAGRVRPPRARAGLAARHFTRIVPSDTGEPGGKRTGQRVSHHVAPGGRFEASFDGMPPEYLLPWTSGSAPSGPEKPKSGRDKVRYRCPGCGTNVWGKPGLLVDCGVCLVPFRP